MAKGGNSKFLQLIGLQDRDALVTPADDHEEPAVTPHSKKRHSPEEPIQLQQHRSRNRVVSHPEISHKVVMFQPGNVEQTTLAINELIDGRSLVVNLEEVDPELAQRIIDTLSGAIYALDGTLKPIAKQTYMLTPAFVEVLDRTGSGGYRTRNPFATMKKGE